MESNNPPETPETPETPKTELDYLEEYAGYFFTLPELAKLLVRNEKELAKAIRTEGSPEYTAYHKGRLLAEAKIRKSIFSHAAAGSSPAQQMALGIIEDSLLKK